MGERTLKERQITRNQLLPDNPKDYRGFGVVRPITLAFLLIVVVRSAIHLFAPDGGAESIAGIDLSVSGGNNIIALFHQWGAIQLLLVGLLLILFFAYKGFTPLIILFLALDAPMRAVAGMMMAIESTHTPPGKAATLPAGIALAILFIFSLLQKKSKPKV